MPSQDAPTHGRPPVAGSRARTVGHVQGATVREIASAPLSAPELHARARTPRHGRRGTDVLGHGPFLGMMMLPPVTVALPFKLQLFVLVND